MAQLLKRIIRAEIPNVILQDLHIHLKRKGDSIDLLALDVQGNPIRSLERICASAPLDALIKAGKLSLWDEHGHQLTGVDIEKATNLATLHDSETGGGTSDVADHGDLDDMPDTTGINEDHDVRYVAKVQDDEPTIPDPFAGMFWYDTDAIPTPTPNVEDFTTNFIAGSIPFSNGTNLTEDNSNLFWNNSSKELGVGVNTPAYRFSVGSADGTDQVGIFHDNTFAYLKWTDGSLILQTDEGVNSPSAVSILSKGNEAAYLTLESQTSGSNLIISTTDGGNSFITSSAGALNLQYLGTAGLTVFNNVVSGVTQELQIYGFRTGDALRSLSIGVGVDAADTASFDGVSNYLFDGQVNINSTDSSDQINIYHNNTDAYIKWNDGSLILQTDEGTDTNTYLDIKGKGTGISYFRIYDQDDAEWFEIYTSSGTGYISTAGASPGPLRLQNAAHANVHMFTSATEGETRELIIYGYRTGDSLRTLDIGVGVDAADTASFDGVSNYLFDGNILGVNVTSGSDPGHTHTDASLPDPLTSHVSINQSTHSLSVGDIVRFNGTIYVKAQADSAQNAEVIGIVSAVEDADNFTLVTNGYVSGLSSLVPSSVYFLSDITAGELSSVEPSATDYVSKPLLVASSNTAGYFLNYKGQINKTKVGITSIDNDSDTVSVVFTSAYADTNYVITPIITNTTDASPSHYSIEITAKATTGFTITLSTTTDSANYDLEWRTIAV